MPCSWLVSGGQVIGWSVGLGRGRCARSRWLSLWLRLLVEVLEGGRMLGSEALMVAENS